VSAAALTCKSPCVFGRHMLRGRVKSHVACVTLFTGMIIPCLLQAKCREVPTYACFQSPCIRHCYPASASELDSITGRNNPKMKHQLTTTCSVQSCRPQELTAFVDMASPTSSQLSAAQWQASSVVSIISDQWSAVASLIISGRLTSQHSYQWPVDLTYVGLARIVYTHRTWPYVW